MNTLVKYYAIDLILPTLITCEKFQSLELFF